MGGGDTFPQGRPDLAAAGVTLASDVTPFEHMKLRLLNGTHSTMAYLGYLAARNDCRNDRRSCHGPS